MSKSHLGLYQQLAIQKHFLAEGRLYFKVNDATRAHYVEQGMEPFTYEQRGRTMTMSYYEVPPDVLENRVDLVAWAERAIEVAALAPRKAKRLR